MNKDDPKDYKEKLDTLIDRESKTQILRPTILSQAPRPKTGRTNQRT